MITRILNTADVEAFWHLRLAGLRGDPAAFGADADQFALSSPEAMRERLAAQDNGSFVMGAFEGEELIGIAGFVRHTGPKKAHSGFIWGVNVSANHRGKGVGRAVMTHLLDRLRTYPDLRHVLLTVSDPQGVARNLYASLGFTSYGIEPEALFVDGRYLDEEHMVLKLR